MNSHTKFLCLLFILSLSFIISKQTSALTYQQDIGVNFTFNSALVITLSSPDIVINNLTPGTASDSNIVTVNVLTNSTSGYTLNASVGNSSTYNTRNLTNPNVSNTFTSLNYGSSVASLNSFSDNNWGYSFSINDGSTWSNYSGLPLYSDTTNIATLKTTTGPSADNGDNIKFKIGAKASTAQPSGEYKNVINFTLVAEPTPMTLFDAYASANKTMLNGYYKMQDMNSTICSDVEVYGDDSAMQVIDIRDNKTYWIAKLADDNCWMTQNLDLDIDSSVTYTNQNTDLGWNGSSYSAASWTPSASTKPSTDTTWGINNNTTPQSYDPGDLYWSGTLNDSTPVSSGNPHYHLGNYYNWTAAIAMNNSSSYTANGTVVEQSICPSSWTLPRTGNNNKTFQALWEQYGYNDSYEEFDDITHITGTPAYFTTSGYFNSSLQSFGYAGGFWSSVVYDNFNAWFAYFLSDGKAYSLEQTVRYFGYPVRCLAR